MKAYGYADIELGELLELESISICGDASEFRRLASFFHRCAEEMASNPDWDHVHFLYSREGDGLSGVDLVAAKLLDVNK